MRRPLNWVVVCLSLLFLVANLSVDRKQGVGVQTALPELAESKYADILSIEKGEPQFGYVRADGSFLPLIQQADAVAAADVGAAVYTWSAPISSAKVPASF
jgi:hypothetical protein